MNHQTTPPEDDATWENDAVWKLLGQAPAPIASTHFASDTLRQARISEAPRAWWQRLPFPRLLIPTAGLAAIGIAMVTLYQKQATPLAANTYEIEEIAETEMLLAAVDHLDDFSDDELVSLIGF